MRLHAMERGASAPFSVCAISVRGLPLFRDGKARAFAGIARGAAGEAPAGRVCPVGASSLRGVLLQLAVRVTHPRLQLGRVPHERHDRPCVLRMAGPDYGRYGVLEMGQKPSADGARAAGSRDSGIGRGGWRGCELPRRPVRPGRCGRRLPVRSAATRRRFLPKPCAAVPDRRGARGCGRAVGSSARHASGRLRRDREIP